MFRSHPALVTPDAVGVELELEGFTSEAIRTATSHLNPLWAVTTDGSLRNGGVEFITAGGLGGERLYGAYERMVSLLDRVNYDASWRCSTHMHVNMLDFTVNQVARFMLVYAACEPIVFQHCGAFRRSSNFCTPVGDSIPFHKALISRLYDDVVSNRGAANQCNKYTALNFLPLFGDGRTRALGTVEFRGGRPMVSMEDLLLQTNLLLSMKHFVRTFEGTEEQMLARLNDGVHNVVFLNGIADTLQVNGQDLEDSLIHSWLLLKAYQEGMSRPRPARPTAPPGRGPSLSDLVRPSRAAMVLDEDFNNQVLAIQEAVNHLGFQSSGRPRSSMQAFRGTDYQAEVSGFTQAQWPRLYDYIEDLQNVNRGIERMAEFAYMVMIDGNFQWSLNENDALRAVTMWKLERDSTNEQTPFGTVIRAINTRRRLGATPGVNTECVVNNLTTVNQPHVLGAIARNVNFLASMTSEQRSAAGMLMGIPRARLTNKRIWNFLVDQTVNVRAPRALRDCLAMTTGIQYDFAAQRWNPLYLRFLLKWAVRTSAQHVMIDDLEVYDKVNGLADILTEAGLQFPVLLRRGPRHPHKVYITSDDSKLCWDLTASQNMRRTEPRLSPVTGKLIY